MSLMYHPRNSHCIYIDTKASQQVFNAVNAIIGCYREVFLQVVKNCLFLKYLCSAICKKILCYKNG